jgi:GDP-L-fucose synthase
LKGKLQTTFSAHPNHKIFVTGHKGLIGSAVVRSLQNKGYKNILVRDRSQVDLLNQTEVYGFYAEHKPDVVINCAAKVGGIHANSTYGADFIFENLQIQNNVIWGAHLHDVQRLVFLGSSCIYPKNCPQPMREEHLLTGELEPTNQPYALAKIAGLEMVNSIRKQYGRDWFSVMPTNLFGPGDNYHPLNSHVLPALIRRFAEAHKAGAPEVAVWGSGKPRREFLYSLDCAEMIVSLMERSDLGEYFDREFGGKFCHLNLGTGEDVSIAELANMVTEAVGYQGKIVFDASKPDGTLRKLQDVSRTQSVLNFKPRAVKSALVETVLAYLSQS